jgi:preprotein translocase subunit SecE
MARNRQRAKDRQARRKAQQGDGNAKPKPELTESELLRAGAPPEDTGTSAEVLEYEQDLDASRDGEHFDPDEDLPEEDLTADGAKRRSDAEKHKDRPRFVQFLVAVWAELQRVQWPDRQALTTLTGVVLGFVLIAGGYLGLLDAIASRVIQAII